MKEILLTQGYVALVDDEDYERVNQFKWYALKWKNTFTAVRHKTILSRPDAKETGLPRQKLIYMHRFIMEAPDDKDVDHVNHNGLDNQKHNLRICTTTQNLGNQLPQHGKTSKYKGVYWHGATRKWMARIQYKREQIYLGLFAEEGKAAKAYDSKAKELFGEFAHTNFTE